MSLFYTFARLYCMMKMSIIIFNRAFYHDYDDFFRFTLISFSHLTSNHFTSLYMLSFRSVQSLLSDPNPASPANAEASQLYERDRGYVLLNIICCFTILILI